MLTDINGVMLLKMPFNLMNNQANDILENLEHMIGCGEDSNDRVSLFASTNWKFQLVHIISAKKEKNVCTYNVTEL